MKSLAISGVFHFYAGRLYSIYLQKMIDIFGMAGLSVNRQLQCNCLKHEDDPDFLAISDLHLAIFLLTCPF